MTSSTSVYSDIELSTEVMAASPHRQIQLLLDKCLRMIDLAKDAINNNEIKIKNNSINRANDIIVYLRNCLKFEDNTKDIATLLEKNYVFVEKCFLNATLKNEIHYLEMASTIIANIKSGWDGIA